MSKFEEVIAACKAQSDALGLGISEETMVRIAKGLGPSIYNNDASKVSGSDQSELDRVKNNFLIKKLGLTDSPALDAAVSEVIEKMGKSNRDKFRVNVYSLLAMKFGK